MANVPNDLPIKAVGPALPSPAPRVKAAPATPAPQAADVVDISPQAKAAAKLLVKLEAIPEFRPGVVAEARARINSAAPASVAAAQLAEKLLTEN